MRSPLRSVLAASTLAFLLVATAIAPGTAFAQAAAPVIGVAKSASGNGTQFTIDLHLENFEAEAIQDLALFENLDAVFGANNYAIVSPPFFVDDPGTLVLNGSFNGSSDPNLLAAGSTLSDFDTAQLRFVVNVTTVVDVGDGLGIYSNQVTFSGENAAGTAASDLSDSGEDPDPNGNGDPTEDGEDDPTLLIVGEAPSPLTFLVTKLADTNDGTCDADCSLREALAAADANAATEVDRIEFAPSVTGTIPLGGSELVIASDVVVDGPGAQVLAVDGGSQFNRVFNIANPGGAVHLSGLTIQGGRTSGNAAGVLVGPNSTLTLSESVVSGNTANFGGAGGGLFVEAGGALNLVRSLVSGNFSTINGGGLYNNGGTVVISASTISSNTRTTSNSSDVGAGIYQASGSTTLNNTTVTGNRPSNNGEGLGIHGFVNAGGTATLNNSIIGGNDGTDTDGAFVSNGSNVIGAPGTATGLASDVIANPLLGPLADNGGPTLTHALLPGSPAIDIGGTCGPEDQRGEAAPVAGTFGGSAVCDAGAVEQATPPPPPTVTLLASGAEVFESSGAPQAVTLTATASAPVNGDQTVTLAVAGLDPSDVTLGSTTITILDGETTGTTTLTAVDDSEREVRETATVSITGVSAGLSAADPASVDVDVRDTDLPDDELAYLYELADFYDPSPFPNNWRSTDDPCTTFTGILCFEGRVVQLDVQSGDVPATEPLPPGFSKLSGLINVRISNFALPGTLDQFELGEPGALNFPSLQRFQVPFNALSGELPEVLTVVANEEVTLNNNCLSGAIPAFPNNTTPRVRLETNFLSEIPADWTTYTRQINYNLYGPDVPATCDDPFGNCRPDRADVVPTTDLAVTPASPTAASLTWTPIVYTGLLSGGGGGPCGNVSGATETLRYEVLTAPSADGPFTVAETLTPSGGTDPSGATLTGLTTGETVYVAVKTVFTAAGQEIFLQTAPVAVTPVAAPQTFVVTKTDDTNDGTCDSDCSLREAIAAANANPPEDTITFSDGTDGTTDFTALPAKVIRLTEGQLSVSGTLTLEGTGAGLVHVSGNNASRIFLVNPGANFTVQDVTLKDGNPPRDDAVGQGGAIRVETATVTLVRSVLTDNASPNGGGGVALTTPSGGSTLTVESSTIVGNTSVSSGGGIFARGDIVNVFNSTVSGNESTGGSGGGIHLGGASVLTLENATIANNVINRAGGFGLGGGIGDAIGTATINAKNTIIAGNSASGFSGPDIGATITSQGYNVIGNTNGGNVNGDPTGNVLNQPALLAPLAHYGGPTPTHALQVGSPALDIGGTCGPADQRGLTAPVAGPTGTNALCDAGAYEARSSLPPAFTKAFAPDEVLADTPTTLTFTIDNTATTDAAAALAFTDVFPVGMIVASPANATNTCGGTFEANSDAPSVTLSGGSVAASATCSLSVDVQASETAVNASNDLTSTLGNSGVATATLTVFADGTPPTVEITTTSPNPTAVEPIPVTFTFSEPVTGFEATDVTVIGGTISDFDDSGAPVYTANVNPDGPGEVTVSVAAGVAADLAGNPNEASNTLAVTFDDEGPAGYTASFDQDAVNAANETAVSFTISDAEAGASFVYTITSDGGAGEVTGSGTIGGAAPRNGAPAGLRASMAGNKGGPGGDFLALATLTSEQVTGLDVSSLPDGTLTLAVTLTDPLGNTGDEVTDTVRKDTVAPTVVVSTTAPDPTNTEPIPVTFTFSEDVTGLSVSDVTVTGGTLGALATSDNVTITSNVTPDGSGEVTVAVAADQTSDLAGNGNAASNTLAITFDGDAPTVVVSTTASNPTNTEPIPVTFTFSEDVTGFEASDVTVTGGTLGTLATSDNVTFMGDVTPDGSGEVTVAVAAGVATDTAGNGNAASNTLAITFDDEGPAGYTAAFDQGAVNAANETVVSFTISDAEEGASYAYTITSDGGAGEVTGSGTIGGAAPRTPAAMRMSGNKGGSADLPTLAVATLTSEQVTGIDVSSLADGTLSLSVTLTDPLGNTGDAVTDTVLKDTVAPTVVVSTTAPDPTNTEPIPVTFTFSEDVTGLSVSDVTVTGGTLGALSTSDNVTITSNVTPDGSGEVTVAVAADQTSDLAGNGNAASNTLAITFDGDAPTVVVSTTAPDPTNTEPIPVTFTFSEEVSGFEAGDVTVTGGTLGALATGDNTTFTGEVTPDGSGEVTVAVAAGVADDTAGNGNAASNTLAITFDGDVPVLTIATTTPEPTVQSPFPVTFTFSEDVTGFTEDDIDVTNGTLSDFDDSAAPVYTANVTPTDFGEVIVSVDADVATDAAGNGNTADSLTRTYEERFDLTLTTSFVFDGPGTGTLTATVTNTGSVLATRVRVKITKTFDVATGPKQIVVGALAPGESGDAVFDFGSAGTNAEVRLKVEDLVVRNDEPDRSNNRATVFLVPGDGGADTLAPEITGTLSGQVFAGTAEENRIDDTGVASLALDPGATNLQLSVDPFAAGATVVSYTATPIDPTMDASGTLRATDVAGNPATRAVSIPAPGTPPPDPPEETLVVRLTPDEAPIFIGVGGGSFTFTGEVTNPTDGRLTQQVWLVLISPSGAEEVQFGPFRVRLQAGGMTSERFTVTVGSEAEAGTYTYEGRVGDFPGEVTDRDSFTFEKLGGSGLTGGSTPTGGAEPLAARGERGLSVADDATSAAPTSAAPLSAASPSTASPGAAQVVLPVLSTTAGLLWGITDDAEWAALGAAEDAAERSAREADDAAADDLAASDDLAAADEAATDDSFEVASEETAREETARDETARDETSRGREGATDDVASDQAENESDAAHDDDSVAEPSTDDTRARGKRGAVETATDDVASDDAASEVAALDTQPTDDAARGKTDMTRAESDDIAATDDAATDDAATDDAARSKTDVTRTESDNTPATDDVAESTDATERGTASRGKDGVTPVESDDLADDNAAIEDTAHDDATETRGKADVTQVASDDVAGDDAAIEDTDDATPAEDNAATAETDDAVADIEAAPVAASTAALPAEVTLHAAYPNPFSRTATLNVDLPEATHLTVTVYDLLGRTVATLADGTTEAGTHALTLDAASLSAGVYVVRLTTAEGEAQTQRLTLVR